MSNFPNGERPSARERAKLRYSKSDTSVGKFTITDIRMPVSNELQIQIPSGKILGFRVESAGKDLVIVMSIMHSTSSKPEVKSFYMVSTMLVDDISLFGKYYGHFNGVHIFEKIQ